MKKETLAYLLNPFLKIAGFPALAWGVLGMIVCMVGNYYTGWHYHGLLHFGPAPNPAFWCFAAEVLVIWLVPFLIFYAGGLLLSKSKIRVIDVAGTTAFSFLPFIPMNIIYYLSDMGKLSDPEILKLSPQEMLQQAGGLIGIMITSLLGIFFLVWTLIWLYKALKVSCNLKGAPLIILYIVGVVGGDILCRIIISRFY